MAETWLMRGEGGSVIPMDLPFSESIQQRVDAGLILRVNPDGSSWVEGNTPAPKPEPKPEPEPERDPDPDGDVTPVRPAHGDPKADWIAYAVSVSELTEAEASAMTKAQLVERFAK